MTAFGPAQTVQPPSSKYSGGRGVARLYLACNLCTKYIYSFVCLLETGGGETRLSSY